MKRNLAIIVECRYCHPEFGGTRIDTTEFKSLVKAEKYFNIQKTVDKKSGGIHSTTIYITSKARA